MKLLDVASVLGIDLALETILWWGLLYFIIVYVFLGLLGEVVRSVIKAVARALSRRIVRFVNDRM